MSVSAKPLFRAMKRRSPAADARDPLDYDPTPPDATAAFLAVEIPEILAHGNEVWEPAVGAGHMARVMEVLANWPQVSRSERGAFVRTSCILPSGSLLSVSVQPAIDGWIVSDEGSAAWEASSSGRDVDDALAGLRSILAQKGLNLQNGKIYSPRVSSGELPYMVAYLATAALDASRWLTSKAAKATSETIVDALPRHLRMKFPDFVMPEPLSLLGDTDKAYTFRNVLLLPDRRRLILDPVLRQDSAIKSRIVANIDVARAKHANLVQHIVYDDADEWTEPELALLTVGAPIVSFSNVDSVVGRLVA